jgi:hypothetical protein
MRTYLNFLRGLPLPTRLAYAGGSTFGALGAIVGLVVGLYGNPPTAPFAVVEAGLPATIAGGVVGLVVGSATALLASAVRRMRRHQGSSG